MCYGFPLKLMIIKRMEKKNKIVAKIFLELTTNTVTRLNNVFRSNKKLNPQSKIKLRYSGLFLNVKWISVKIDGKLKKKCIESREGFVLFVNQRRCYSFPFLLWQRLGCYTRTLAVLPLKRMTFHGFWNINIFTLCRIRFSYFRLYKCIFL